MDAILKLRKLMKKEDEERRKKVGMRDIYTLPSTLSGSLIWWRI